MSSPHKLECRRYRVLKRGQRNLFVLRTERLLGPVDHLVVWIEGYKDNWLCHCNMYKMGQIRIIFDNTYKKIDNDDV